MANKYWNALNGGVLLGAAGFHLGVQTWVGLIAGPTMFHHMERPAFGAIQSKLFPKYGLIGASAATIAASAAILGDLPDVAVKLATILDEQASISHFAEDNAVGQRGHERLAVAGADSVDDQANAPQELSARRHRGAQESAEEVRRDARRLRLAGLRLHGRQRLGHDQPLTH